MGKGKSGRGRDTDGADTTGPCCVGEGEGLWVCVAARAVAGAWNHGLVWMAATRAQAHTKPRHAETGQRGALMRGEINGLPKSFLESELLSLKQNRGLPGTRDVCGTARWKSRVHLRRSPLLPEDARPPAAEEAGARAPRSENIRERRCAGSFPQLRSPAG